MNYLLLLLLALFPITSYAQESSKNANVGLCITATGRYTEFVGPLIESARRNFLPGYNVTYFVFTDGVIPQAPDIVRVEQKRVGWPLDSMMRFDFYAKNKNVFEGMDYLYAIDADMRIEGNVSSRILGDLVATQHPGYVGKRGTYETNPQSLAYVASKEGKYYFCGGFWGGKKDRFIKTCTDINIRIQKDLKRGVIAVWHDESHLNRYFIDNPPTTILSPAYCYPERWNLPYTRRIIALDKNHSEYRK